MPHFVLSAICLWISSKTLEGDQAFYSHHIMYHDVCNIVEAVKAALLSNAFSIVLAHNHPSGSITASPDDIQTTKHVHAGKIMGVTVLDHLIVTDTGVYSIRESHPDLFES